MSIMKFCKSLVILTAAASIAFSVHAKYGYETSYKVTIKNISKGLSFTPLLTASHNSAFSVFNIGEQASEHVARIAEGGDISGLAEQFDSSEYVYASTHNEGLLEPGMSVELTLTTTRHHRRLSIISMALPTNDTLVALRNKRLPKRHATFFMKAYDGGTETNDELCANIPGPHCGGTPFSPDDLGEGYIYPSPGIHGEGDLSVAAYDWQGAVAKVTVERM